MSNPVEEMYEEQLDQLRRQVAEADAARRHAQAVSSELVKEKRALEAELKKALRINETQIEVGASAGERIQALQSIALAMQDERDTWEANCDEATSEMNRLRELVGQFIEAWDHDGEPNAAAYQDVVEKARRILTGVKQDHLNDAVKKVAPETIQSVTEWANATFGQATIAAMMDRAKKEWDELLDLSRRCCEGRGGEDE